jgi:hypothetical protein
MLIAALGAAVPLALGACSSSNGHKAFAPVQLPGAGTSTTAPAGSSTAAAGSTTAAGTHASGGDLTHWCAELKSAGQAVIALGGSSTDKPDVAKAKIHQLVADAPGDIRPGLEVLEQIDDKILDGDTNADAELATGSNATLIRNTIAKIESQCPGVIDGPTS